jgi:hypothetical protein
MKSFFKKLLAKIHLWLNGPPCCHTSYRDKDEEEQNGRETA